MTQEEKKDILIKDLCARLPYGVKIHKALYGAVTLNERHIESFRKGLDDTLIPYLRPMSSMTEEEEIEYDAWYNSFYIDDLLNCIDWFNAHYFDYRNLIGEGLALEAPEGMYN